MALARDPQAEHGYIGVACALKRELAPLFNLQLPGVVLLVTGDGALQTGRRLREFLAQQPVRQVIFAGYAGGLSPNLQPGDLVVDGETGKVVSSPQIICTAKEKQELFSSLGLSGSVCVDLESAEVAQVCREKNIPYRIVRCITDTQAEDLPLDFNRCRDVQGSLSNLLLLREVLKKPQSIPGLIRLWKRSRLCTRLLSEFLRPLLRF